MLFRVLVPIFILLFEQLYVEKSKVCGFCGEDTGDGSGVKEILRYLVNNELYSEEIKGLKWDIERNSDKSINFCYLSYQFAFYRIFLCDYLRAYLLFYLNFLLLCRY
ncbi:MAG TPA: hypothetical protein QKA37_04220 [Candidatus Megaira endosymbiont of Stentor roeselii]|nr:hypothetical protein [Candidatus Megaera endosymbiont of Stentor roeselii]